MPNRASPVPSPMRRHLLIVAAVIAVTALVSCDAATVVPPGAQVVDVQMTSTGLQLSPAVASPGEIYLVLGDPLHGIEFIHRTANMDDIHGTALPVSDADIASVRAQGTFQGAVIENISLHNGNSVRIGPLVEGKYVLAIENPKSVAVLEVRAAQQPTTAPSETLQATLAAQTSQPSPTPVDTPPISGVPALAGVPMRQCDAPNFAFHRFCGDLEVPVDRTQVDGPTIPIRILVIPALAGDAGATPLFALDGGPGGAGTSELTWMPTVYSQLHTQRDIVIIDQRGTGGSHALMLPPAPDVTELSDADASQRILEWAQAAFAKADVDWTTYTSSVAADDIDDVRAALGYDQIDLFGPSYGGTLAQYYVRQHGDHVRRVVLDGVTPLDVPIFEHMAANSQDALELLLDRCTQDDACATAFPAIEDEWADLLARLQKPVDTGIVDPETGEHVIATMTELAPGLHSALVTSNSAASLPFLIHLAYEGQWQAVAAITGGSGASSASQPLMKQMILCSEAWAEYDPAAVAKLGVSSYARDAGIAIATDQQRFCEPFSNGIVPVDDGAPVITDAPMLWVTGDGDPQDPPANLVNIPLQQPNATIVVVPAQNHTVSHLGCLPDVVASFLSADDPGTIDTSCVGAMSPVPAFRVR